MVEKVDFVFQKVWLRQTNTKAQIKSFIYEKTTNIKFLMISMSESWKLSESKLKKKIVLKSEGKHSRDHTHLQLVSTGFVVILPLNARTLLC